MHILWLLFLLWTSSLSAQLAISPESLEGSLKEHITYSAEGPNYIGHIYIGDHGTQISQGTYIYVKNALKYYQEHLHPIFIILELDTPGGEVFPAQKISDLLKELDTNDEIPVVAYINNWAISAGAMLAYSCRYIATVKDGSMGAAQPVSQSGEKTSEKINSAIRADFAGRASFFDRNPLIAQAMVDAEMVLVVRDHAIVELQSNEEIKKGDHIITRKGKLLTLNAREMIDLGVADLFLEPKKLAPLQGSAHSRGEWPASHSLLFSLPFFNQIPHAIIKSYQMDWKTKFFSFLANPVVSSLLFLGLMIGFYIEISTPGFGVAGGIALICLVLIILSSFAAQASGWLEFILLGVGVGLILLEVFVIPGFGITGILGIILAAVGLGALLLPGISEVHFDFSNQTLNAAGEYILMRAAWLAGALIIGIVIMVLLGRYLVPRLALFSPLIHRGEQNAAQGYVAGVEREHLPDIGALGRAITPLRTAGKIEINQRVFDAVSDGSFIEGGAPIRVIRIEGSKIIVEEIL